MNYIRLIKIFWHSNEEYSFSPTEIALFFYLLEVNNLCSWKESFKRNNAKVMVDLSIKDRRTLNNARNKLKQAKLIDYKSITTNPNVVYSFTCALNTQVDVEANAQVDAQVDVQATSKLMYSKDKLNINKTKLYKKNNKKENLNLNLEFEDKKEKKSCAKKKEVEVMMHETDERFNEFWKIYDYDWQKKDSYTQWRKLSPLDKDKAIYFAKTYIESTPDKKFRKMPLKFIRDKYFDNPINSIQNADQKPKVNKVREQRRQDMAREIAERNNIDIFQEDFSTELDVYNKITFKFLEERYDKITNIEQCLLLRKIKLSEIAKIYGSRKVPIHLIQLWIEKLEIFLGYKDEDKSIPDIETVSSLIYENLYLLTLPELTLFFKGLLSGKYGKFYGKLDIQMMLMASKEFRQERSIALIKIEDRKNTELKSKAEQIAAKAYNYTE